MPPAHGHVAVVGPAWVGAVVSVAVLFLPIFVPHIAKSSRHLVVRIAFPPFPSPLPTFLLFLCINHLVYGTPTPPCALRVPCPVCFACRSHANARCASAWETMYALFPPSVPLCLCITGVGWHFSDGTSRRVANLPFLHLLLCEGIVRAFRNSLNHERIQAPNCDCVRWQLCCHCKGRGKQGENACQPAAHTEWQSVWQRRTQCW